MASSERARFLTLAIFAACSSMIASIPIDNGVEGEPEIECGPNTITVTFNTKNSFEGHVYVKGRYGEAGCRTDQSGKNQASLSLPFSTCGVDRQRSLNPKGIFIGVSVVITFHPQFLTKVDRAYSVQCFYMEADKTVSQDLEVSEMTTAFQTQNVPMPLCRYDILDGGPNGEPIKYGLIGQQVYHKWTCETESIDIFCMLVHSCFVDDGAGSRIQVLNEDGCALDKYVLNNLEYISDLMAGKEAHIVKFADRPALFFQCQVSISIKEPGEECHRPQCAEPASLGGGSSSSTSGGSPPGSVPPTRGASPPAPTPSRPGITPRPGARNGGSSPAPAPTSPNPGSSPRGKSPPSAVPPGSRPPVTPAGVLLPVLSNNGRASAPGGPLLTLGGQQTTRSTTRTSTTRRSSTTSFSTTTRSTTTRAPTTSRSASTSTTTVRFQPVPTPAQPVQIISGTGELISRPAAAPPAPIAPPAPAVPSAPAGPFINSVNLPAITSSPPSSQDVQAFGQAQLSQVQPQPIPPPPPPPPPPSQPQQLVESPAAGLQPPANPSASVPLQPLPAAPPAPPPPAPPAPAPAAARQPNAQGRFDFDSTFPFQFRVRRVRRAADRIDFIGTWDVHAPGINAYEDFDHDLQLSGLNNRPSKRVQSTSAITSSIETDGLYCVPTVLIVLVIGVTVMSLLASIVVALFICLRRRRVKYYVD